MKKKILIIDDEEDVRSYITEVLVAEGYEVATASDGLQGLDEMRSFRPDLVTLDLQMPNDTGTGFYRKIHRDREFADVPIIVISGIAGRHLAIRKPFAVLDKPIDRQHLLDVVRDAIG